MTDILGPANAPNAVTARPADDRTMGNDDTWFLDCTVPGTGTKLKAAVLNALLGQLRWLIRINGLTAEANPVLVEDQADSMLSRAIRHLIQRGQTRYAADTGPVNSLAAVMSPTPPEYKTGMSVRIKVAVTNTGASTLALNGLAPTPIVRPDGSALLAGDLMAGEIVELTYNGTKFQMLAWPPKLAALPGPRTLYISNAIGDDTYDGLTPTTAFKTLQKAWDVASRTIDLAGYTLTFQIADGTYTAGVNALGFLNGQRDASSVVWKGNAANPAAVLINTPNSCFINVSGAMRVQDLKLQSTNGNCLGVNYNGSIEYQNVDFGASGGAHIAPVSGVISAVGNYRISGGAPSHIEAPTSLSIATKVTATITVTLAGTPGFSKFMLAYGASVISMPNVVYSGAANGQKFDAGLNAVIFTAGAGINYFPGSSAGITSTGGQYA